MGHNMGIKVQQDLGAGSVIAISLCIIFVRSMLVSTCSCRDVPSVAGLIPLGSSLAAQANRDMELFALFISWDLSIYNLSGMQ